MGMNIKDPQVQAMARELAEHRGTSVTDAVRQALRAELDRCRTAAPGQQEAVRRQALRQLLSRCRDLPWPDQRSGAELQTQLYNEIGLPARAAFATHAPG
jgi:antitoxin VapB